MKNLIAYNNKLESIIKDISKNNIPFGMDIDDVILKFKNYFRNGINEHFNLNLNQEDIVNYNVNTILPIKDKGFTRKDVYAMLRKIGNRAEFTKLSTNEGVNEIIDLLITYHDNNYDNFFIITSRSEQLYDDFKNKTLENLRFNKIKFHEYNVIFDKEKEYVAKALELKLFFEDNLETALKIIKKNIPIIMPSHEWNKKTPKDTTLLSLDDVKYKHELINEIESYSGKYFFRINNFKELLEYSNDILKR
ncbi:MAG: hypothetical protein KatS3mg002_1160 [Candidatus Woesearchaeota archaeon]|nr:MAG: hypothetical protein KatS3mg002_1160 [Candidatus Woesearchaeota archaeon]